MKDTESQIWDQLKEHATIEHFVDWFGVGEVEAFEMLDDIHAHFDNLDEARDFLSFVMDDNLSDNDKHGIDINAEKWMG